MSIRKWTFVLALALAFPFAAASGSADAQATGGSFGGGSFGGGSGGSSGGGGGGSGGGGWGGGGGGGYQGGGYQGGGYTGAGASDQYRPSGGTPAARADGPRERLGTFGIIGVIAVTSLLGLVVVVMIVRGARMKLPTGQQPQGEGGGAAAPSSSGPPMGSYAGPNAMYLQRLSLGIDWRSRRQVQDTLKRLAETGDTKSQQGLAHLLRESALALRRAEMGWLYVARQNMGSFAPQQAQQRFQKAAMDMRASFRHEVVRAGDGSVHAQEAPEMRAHANEGEGTVVVHLIVASRRSIGVSSQPNAAQIRAALDALGSLTPEQLVALEVVWSPAAENDRMSTAELEQNYPDMQLIDPASIAGRIFCAYCRGPFAMELLTCPHCGAPAEQSKGNTSPRA